MDYLRIIRKSIYFIERNLTEDIAIEDVSDQVNLSFYHFHRIFTAHTGYALKTYVRRRRLTLAADEVVFTFNNLVCIAKKYKFKNLESFIRAFKKEFGVTPGHFRKEIAGIKRFNPLNNISIHANLNRIRESVTHTPKIMTLSELNISGLKCSTNIQENIIPRLWMEYQKIYHKIPNKLSVDRCIGVCLPVRKSYLNENVYFDYIAGHEVGEFGLTTDFLFDYTVKSQKYAVFTHRGALNTLGLTYGYVYGIWANETDLKIVEGDTLEIYDQRFNYGKKDSEMEILIPVI